MIMALTSWSGVDSIDSTCAMENQSNTRNRVLLTALRIVPSLGICWECRHASPGGIRIYNVLVLRGRKHVQVIQAYTFFPSVSTSAVELKPRSMWSRSRK